MKAFCFVSCNPTSDKHLMCLHSLEATEGYSRCVSCSARCQSRTGIEATCFQGALRCKW